MKSTILSIFFINLFISFWGRSDCQSKTFTLGSNLVINPNFQLPDINPDVIEYIYFSFQIVGWKCANKCELLSLPYICHHLDSRYCPMASSKQILDTQSDTLETISQTINLQRSAQYKLSFNWLPPQLYPLQKSLLVWVNQTLIASIYIDQYNQQITKFNNLNLNIVLPAGALVLKFQSKGPNDGYGIYIQDINLAQYTEKNNNYNQWKDSLQYCFGNRFVEIFNKYPGSRIFLRLMINFYINFDRLKFYNYHNQNFTQYSLLLIQRAFIFLEQKGSLFRIIANQNNDLSSLLNKVVDQGSNLQKKLSFKQNYRNNYLYKRNENGGGFIQNEFDFFYYEVPYSIITFLFCLGLFNLLSRFKASLSLRKYCFMGIIFFIFFEGNVEEFTFYTILELKLFFSHNVLHKGVNALLAAFWFAVVFFSFAVLPFCFFCYGRNIKYLVEDCRPIALSLIATSVDSGLVPLASGFIHALFLEQLWPTTVLLVVMELLWVSIRWWFLQKKLYMQNIRIFIQITVSLLRVCLLVTLYLYERSGSSLMNDIHFFVIFSYILFWIMQTFLSLILFFKKLPSLLKCHGNSKSKILPIQQKVTTQNNLISKSKKQSDNIATNTNVKFLSEKRTKFKVKSNCNNFQKPKRIVFAPFNQVKYQTHFV